jgi:hypothetical protein
MEDNLVIPFLDSEKFSNQHSETPKTRAWKDYWPPRRGSKLHLWLETECPEALSWRFDPAKPFNRPWQAWTRQANQTPGGFSCPAAVLPPNLLEGSHVNGLNNNENAFGKYREEVQREATRVNATAEVCKEIAAFGLRCTTAKDFRYISSNAIYDHEKPFHSRLPFLNGLRRTNVVSQQYSEIQIYDVTGFEDKFTLSVSGFSFLSAPVHGITTWTEETVRNVYLPLTESWLKNYFGSKLVHIYTYNVRFAHLLLEPSSTSTD